MPARAGPGGVPPSRSWWAGAAIGIGLSAPLVVAFADYLPHASIGPVNGTFAHVSVPTFDLTRVILPYSLGPLFAFTAPVNAGFSLEPGTSGFLAVTIIASGLIGILGRRQRLLRLGLAAWILVCLLRTFGFPPVVDVMAAIPGVRQTAFFLWSDPSWELAAVVLAGLGLDDIARGAARRRTLVIAALVTALIAAWAAITAWPLLTQAIGPPGHADAPRHVYAVGSLIGACVMLLGLVIGGVLAGSAIPASTERAPRIRSERRRRNGRLLMAGMVAAESMCLFGFTFLSAPKPSALELGSVTWLQSHLGTYRFFTLGPIQANYGSYFGIAEANINDLPTPRTWNNYIRDHLASNALSDNFTGVAMADPSGATPAQQLSANLANYEDLGIRYVVEPAAGNDVFGHAFPGSGSPLWPAGPRLVYHDSLADIWQLPSAAAAFSLTADTGATAQSVAARCTVIGTGWDRATVNCPYQSTLVRRVQYMPGWTAVVNGSPASIRSGSTGLFQEITLPAGRSTVSFSFLPPYETLAIPLAVVAGLIVLGSLVGPYRRRKSRSPQT